MLLLLSLAGGARAQEPEEGQRIGSVAFEGREGVSRSVLADSIVTQASRCRGLLFKPICKVTHASFFFEKHELDPAELQRDVLRLRVIYFRKGYREARVEAVTSPDGDDVNVVFRIVEGPLTTVAAVAVVQTDSVLSDTDLGRMGLPDEGGALDLTLLDSARIRIHKALWDRGYGDALIDDTTTVDPATNAATLVMHLDPGPVTTIGSIVVEGNEGVSDYTIERVLDLPIGSVYRRLELTSAQRRLFETELFRQSVVRVTASTDSAKALTVTVSEAPPTAVRVGAGVNTTDFAQSEARFIRYDFLGGARRLDVRAAVSNLFARQLNGRSIFEDVVDTPFREEADPSFLRPTWQMGLQLTQPFFLSSRNSLGLGLSMHRRIVPGIVVDKGMSADVSVTRQPREGIAISATYRFERADFEAGDLYFCVNFGVCDPFTVSALRQPHKLSPLGLSARLERADDPIAPTSGWMGRVDLEHASRMTLSDFQYQRAAGELSSYFRVRGRSVLAGRVLAGWVRPLTGTAVALDLEVSERGILHPRQRFLSGGARSLRGYAENQMGPKVLTIPARVLLAAADSASAPLCTLASIANGSCDANAVQSIEFRPRPLGGNTLFEASVEYRFPITSTFTAAAFLDAGMLRGQRLNFPPGTRTAFTPGAGLRYRSPIGPVRVDLGFRPSITEELPVVTELVGPDGEARLIQLGPLKRYDPNEGRVNGLRGWLSHLQLHLAIGEAF